MTAAAIVGNDKITRQGAGINCWSTSDMGGVTIVTTGGLWGAVPASYGRALGK